MDYQKRNHLNSFHKRAEAAGGEERVQKQHKQGKLTARERIQRLVDPDTFVEFDKFVAAHLNSFSDNGTVYLGDGVITGLGKINGESVALYSQDFTVLGGTLGEVHAKKICKIMDFAFENKMPLIGMNDSGGARIQEGINSLVGYAEIFHRNVKCSGVIPQITLILGPCAGGAVYSPALTDFVFMVDKTSYMFVTGPEVIKTVTHEDIDKEELGGAKTHSEKSGVAHFMCANEDDCFERVRELLSFIPESCLPTEKADFSTDPIDRECGKIEKIIPDNPKKPYDMKEVIFDIIDNGHFLEIHKNFAMNIITGFASIGGKKVGVVANQPNILAGVLDINASTKAARFVRFCDAFDIPIISLVDVPGFLPGAEQEHGGIINHGSKLIYAYAEATVPLITLITRKAYGGAYIVMASKFLNADVNLAYPSSEIAVMGAEGAVKILYRKELKDLKPKELEKKKNELIENYEKEFSNPYQAASRGYLDGVINPEDTRKYIISGLRYLENKSPEKISKKHGNIQL